MSEATGTDAAIINKQTKDIKELAATMNKLSAKGSRPLPLKAPIPYKRSDGSFYAYAEKLENYFKAMQIIQADRPKLLPNFLAAKEFELVTRIHSASSFAENDLGWEKAVENIVEVLQHDLTVAGALSKLQKIKQGQKSISQFVSEIERLGKRAFPEKHMVDAFDRACIASIQTNCRSRVLSLEIYRAVKHAEHAKKNLTFSEIAKLAMEMDAVLMQNSDSEDESGATKRHVLNINQNVQGTRARTQTKRCFECNSPEHLVRYCPNVRPQDNSYSEDMGYTDFHPGNSSYNTPPYSLNGTDNEPYNNDQNSTEWSRSGNNRENEWNGYSDNRNREQQSTNWPTVNMVKMECDQEAALAKASSLKFIQLDGPTSKCSEDLSVSL